MIGDRWRQMQRLSRGAAVVAMIGDRWRQMQQHQQQKQQ